MHETSIRDAEYFRRRFLASLEDKELRVLEVGSRNPHTDGRRVLRDILANPKWEFVGVDGERGKGVDHVLADPWDHKPYPGGHYHIVVSSSCMEHDRFFWITLEKMYDALRPGGLLYINVPTEGPYHGYPGDYWRMRADAPRAWVEWLARSDRSMTLLEVALAKHGTCQWKNLMVIMQKRVASPKDKGKE